MSPVIDLPSTDPEACLRGRLTPVPEGSFGRQFTVKKTAPNALPSGVATVTVLVPAVLPASGQLAATVVLLVAVTEVHTTLPFTPVPVNVTPVALAKLVPVIVTPTTPAGVPAVREPEVGEIDEILAKFVVSVAVLVTDPAVTLTTFDVELAFASRIAIGANGERLPRSV
jgi:hypothetical protein